MMDHLEKKLKVNSEIYNLNIPIIGGKKPNKDLLQIKSISLIDNMRPFTSEGGIFSTQSTPNPLIFVSRWGFLLWKHTYFVVCV